jgi:FixJ family two-component response regulator
MSRARPVVAVVDDEEAIRRALRRLLRASGYDVTTFASGHEFIDSLARSRPDCALLDLHLPGLSGLDLLKQLHLLQPPVPSVVVTGHDVLGVKARAMLGGASDYLLKPLDDNVLLAAVATAIAGRSA